jgi:hypothetical protein
LIKVEWHLHTNRIELKMMLKLAVKGIANAEANRIKGGGLDANGLPAVVKRAEGRANPCRHCLQLIAEGDDKLVLSYRPFEDLQPHAEAGPSCSRYEDHVLPAWFAHLHGAVAGERWLDCWPLGNLNAQIPDSSYCDRPGPALT